MKILKLLTFGFIFCLPHSIYAQIKINEPAVVQIYHNRVTIEWTTNLKASAIIRFGTTEKTKRHVKVKKFHTGHSTILGRLKTNTRYFFKIVAKDKKGQVSVTPLYAFKTRSFSSSDDTILKITSPPQVTHLSPKKVIISWQTNETSSSIITYGFKKLKRPKTYFSEVETTAHIITLEDLVPNTRYFYQVRSRDRSGKLVKSTYASFQTQGKNTISALPTIKNGPAVYSRRAREARIQWQTDRPCKSYVTWGKVPLASFHTKKDVTKTFSKSHEMKLTGLKPGIQYYYIVYLEDRNGRKSNSEVYSVKTDKFQ